MTASSLSAADRERERAPRLAQSVLRSSSTRAPRMRVLAKRANGTPSEAS